MRAYPTLFSRHTFSVARAFLNIKTAARLEKEGETGTGNGRRGRRLQSRLARGHRVGPILQREELRPNYHRIRSDGRGRCARTRGASLSSEDTPKPPELTVILALGKEANCERKAITENVPLAFLKSGSVTSPLLGEGSGSEPCGNYESGFLERCSRPGSGAKAVRGRHTRNLARPHSGVAEGGVVCA